MAGPTPARQHEPIRLKWAGWLDRVKSDVLTASLERVVWTEIKGAIEERAPETPDTFLHHYTRMYAHTQSMAVRRLMLHRNSDERSLSSLIKNFIVHPDVVTRERYADNVVAHVGPPVPAPTFGELDAAIDITEAMFIRYSLLLTGSSWVLPPVIQETWRRTFDRPLFPATWEREP